jgi:serine protease Do
MPCAPHSRHGLRILMATILASLCVSILPETPLAAFSLWQEGRSTPLATTAPQPPAFVELAKALNPTVVNISSKQQVRRPRSRAPFGGENDPFDFFERFFGRRGPRPRRPSLGSGFIIHPTGYIVTNNHVVDGATEIKVTLATQEEFDATLVGRDPKTDIALLKIDTDLTLPAAPLGDSDALEVGDWVMAIGNPFGLGHTVTAGIVSAKGRVIDMGPYDNFIQTDASINPGNSGGPLFNMRGEVVGINTAIVAAGQGLGFATPSNMAKEVLLDLYSKGSVTRGWLGVGIQELSRDLSQAFGLEEPHGALVSEVLPDSPAAKAGIRRGDIIVGFDGKRVPDASKLPHMVAVKKPGSAAEVELLRDGKRLTLPVVLGEMAEEEDKEAAAEGLHPSDVEEALGLQVQDITPEVAQALRLEDTAGVVVSHVEPDSPAAEAGIRRGDIVREVAHQAVKDEASYQAAMQKAIASRAPNKPVLLLLERRGSGIYAALMPRKTE